MLLVLADNTSPALSWMRHSRDPTHHRCATSRYSSLLASFFLLTLSFPATSQSYSGYPQYADCDKLSFTGSTTYSFEDTQRGDIDRILLSFAMDVASCSQAATRANPSFRHLQSYDLYPGHYQTSCSQAAADSAHNIFG